MYEKYGKRQANKKVRRSDQTVLLKGKQYRKLYETWDINDVIQFWSRRDAQRHGELDIWKNGITENRGRTKIRPSSQYFD